MVAIFIISSLLNPAKGLKMGILIDSEVALIFEIVWDATWPTFSPVINAFIFNLSANKFAIECIDRLKKIIQYLKMLGFK